MRFVVLFGIARVSAIGILLSPVATQKARWNELFPAVDDESGHPAPQQHLQPAADRFLAFSVRDLSGDQLPAPAGELLKLGAAIFIFTQVDSHAPVQDLKARERLFAALAADAMVYLAPSSRVA